MLITSGLHGQSNAAGEFTIERTALLVGLDDGFTQPPDLGGVTRHHPAACGTRGIDKPVVNLPSAPVLRYSALRSDDASMLFLHERYPLGSYPHFLGVATSQVGLYSVDARGSTLSVNWISAHSLDTQPRFDQRLRTLRGDGASRELALRK